MIVALFALAAAMVIGGSAAVIQGFPFVRLESGLAMVIAGSVTASAGAVLAGLGVVAVSLRRVERGLKDRSVPVPTALPPFPDLARAEGPALPPRPVLPAAPAAGLGAIGLVGAALGAAGRRQAEPTFEDALFEPAPPEAPREPELPMPGLEPRPEAHDAAPGAPPEGGAGAPQVVEDPPQVVEDPPRADETPPRAGEEPQRAVGIPARADEEPPRAVAAPEPAGAVPEAAEDDLFARPDAPEAESRPNLRPSLDPDEAPAEPAVEPPAPSPAAPRREVVGKYASGGNTYVMFADGSIEAETPQGRFTFASLDELKAFVDAGGERSARGAA